MCRALRLATFCVQRSTIRDDGLAAASYSNTLGVGTAIDSLPLDSISKLEGLWFSDGEGDYRIDDEEEKDGGACGLGRSVRG